ncbi:LysR family transcriptional regulator [Hasllibacter halocynthiae]|uniref:LysR family transcriptional regulator n=1 Tax=Hasllibacter halocynthiae TaxID=595589 RepID=A0A2T0X3L8_9RHOB|nr:LysR family transcriptional regulator [Hasllibacter halocynthiae]PRY93546.1 LysR family transcriptional regulator [Hasllibacter halocynthiae]
MAVDSWDEIRTAYHVARAGTVSGAAEALGVHHATVIRHVGSLEASLGVKLFQRHARGYTPTEAGQDLLTVARATDDQFEQLVSRVKGRGAGIGGELVVTSLHTVSPFLVPVIHAFQREHPGLTVRYLTGDEVLRLEYGEAHVAVRAGSRPEQLDNVVQRFLAMPVALYASRDYLARAGTPESEAQLAGHDFVALDDAQSRAPFQRWLVDNIPAERIVFRVSDHRVIRQAILEGVGLGFSTPWEAARHPELVQVMPPREEWSAPLWLVTHVDLHRTAKVQGFLDALKAAAKGGTVGTSA